MKFDTKLIPHYPSYLGMSLRYFGKLKIRIFCIYSVPKLWKSVNIWQSYREFKGGNFL